MLFASARLQHPQCRCVCLTDQDTELECDYYIEVVRIHSERMYPIYHRLEAQQVFLQKDTFSSHYIFLDWDILIQKPLDHVFKKHFDIGFTYCFDSIMPINTGVILVHARGKEKAILFLKRVQECWDTLFFKAKVWWGDQLSVITTVGYQNFYTRSYDFIISSGTRILLLPCALYNFTDESSSNKMDKEYPYPRILHFRGKRKLSMSSYWEKCLQALV